MGLGQKAKEIEDGLPQGFCRKSQNAVRLQKPLHKPRTSTQPTTGFFPAMTGAASHLNKPSLQVHWPAGGRCTSKQQHAQQRRMGAVSPLPSSTPHPQHTPAWGQPW